MTRCAVVLLFALGAAVLGLELERVKTFRLYNKGIFKTVPLSEYPTVLGYLKEAVKNGYSKPQYLLVAEEIIRHPEKEAHNKRCFITEYADEAGKLFGAGFSRYNNGTVVLNKAPNSFIDEDLSKLIKAGKVDEARQHANKVIQKLARKLEKGKPPVKKM